MMLFYVPFAVNFNKRKIAPIATNGRFLRLLNPHPENQIALGRKEVLIRMK